MRALLTAALAIFAASAFAAGFTSPAPTGDGLAGMFGDAADGDADFDGSNTVVGYIRSGSVYTAQRDVWFRSATVRTGVTVLVISTAYGVWHGPFIKDTLTLEGTAALSADGVAGHNASGQTGGTAGSAFGDIITAQQRVLTPPTVNIAGANGGAIGGAGSNSVTSVCGAAGTTVDGAGGGGAGGAGATSTGAGGTGGGGTITNLVDAFAWRLPIPLGIRFSGQSVVVAVSSRPGCGGGGGGGSGTEVGNGGGAGGGGGGSLFVFAKTINATSWTGKFYSRGGRGGDASTSVGGGIGGAGGGGGGGFVYVVYHQSVGTVSSSAVDVSGGAAGTGNGTATSGQTGSYRLLQF